MKMAEFMNLLRNKSTGGHNVSVTENGAIGYRTTGKALLDLNFSVASFRNEEESTIIEKWYEAYIENPELALKWLFYVRDIRQGMGEKRLFKIILKWMAKHEPNVIRPLIIPEIMGEYGCWKDIFELFDTPLEDTALRCIYTQLSKDIDDCKNNKPISLLAKWMPSINTSSNETRKKAKKIQANLVLTEEGYRRILSKLRKYLKVVERDMSDNKWSEIDYKTVPSVANMRYTKSFMNHDSERRKKYLIDVASGKEKINSKDLYPYQISSELNSNILRKMYGYKVRKTFDGKFERSVAENVKAFLEENSADLNFLEGMWKNLPNLVTSDANILVIRDGSGSMFRPVEGTRTALDVADSLTLYFAERLKGAYHNTFITFSSQPEVVTIPDTVIYEGNEVPATLLDKEAFLSNYSDYTNTNLEKVFDLILSIAVSNNLTQDELPTNLLIVSDMEFDNATVPANRNDALFEIIDRKFKNAGYNMPKLIFWNVNSRTKTIPVCENENGLILVSGFSINILKMVMSNKLDPYEALLETLNSERYARITYEVCTDHP